MLPFIDLRIIQIPVYGFCIATGLALSVFVAWRLIVWQKKNFWDFVIVSTVALAVGFVFAKLLYVVVSFPPKDFFRVLFSMLTDSMQAAGGFVFYGGLAGGFVGLLLGCKIAKCKIKEYINLFAVIVPLAHAFGRIGCFCAGCCYGIPYEGFFSVRYTKAISTVPMNTGIFPVQLLESLLLVVLFFLLLKLFLAGFDYLWVLYLISYAVVRFFLEFLRFDNERGFLLDLSVSQFISLVVVFVLLLFLLLSKLFKKTSVTSRR